MDDFLKRAFTYYQGLGYSPVQAAAMAGNAHWESAGGNPLAVGDAGKSFGLFQWDRNRKAGLFSYAKDKGLDPEAESTQLAYADYELRNAEKKAGDKFFASTDLTGANDALMGYLRPQGSENSPQGSHGYVNRYNNGAELLNQPAMAQALAMPPSQNIGFGPQPAMQQAAPDPRTANDADLGGYGGSPALTPGMPGVASTDYRGLLAASNLAGKLGSGLLASANTPGFQPMAVPNIQINRGNPQALQELPDFVKRRLGLLG